MSRAIEDRRQQQDWGPNHQHMRAPWERERRPFWKLLGWFLAAMFLHTIIDNRGSVANEPVWCLKVMLLAWIVKRVVRGVREDRIPIDWLMRIARGTVSWMLVQFARRAPIALLERIPAFNTEHGDPGPEPMSLTDQARAEIAYRGGGAYLGVTEDGSDWVTADRESAVMVLGPPRSGKTSAVMIPAVLSYPGPAISTSTKPDVMKATQARSRTARRGMAVRPRRRRATATRRRAPALVPRRSRGHVGSGADHGQSDDGSDGGREGNDEREPLDQSAPPRCSHHCCTPRTSPIARSRTCCTGRCART